MKALMMFLCGAAAALVCVWLASGRAARVSGSPKHTFSSFDPPRGTAAALQFDTGQLNLADADLEQILNLYQEVSARVVIRGANLPRVKISLHSQTPLTRVGTLQLLDTTLAQNGVTMVLVGDTQVKAVTNGDARSETPPTIDPVANELPDSDSYMTCTVRLKNADPQHVFALLQTASRMPNGIVYNPTGKLLILRDYSSSIRQMLRLIQDVDHPPSPLVDILHLTTNAAGRRP